MVPKRKKKLFFKKKYWPRYWVVQTCFLFSQQKVLFIHKCVNQSSSPVWLLPSLSNCSKQEKPFSFEIYEITGIIRFWGTSAALLQLIHVFKLFIYISSKHIPCHQFSQVISHYESNIAKCKECRKGHGINLYLFVEWDEGLI